jgi:hydrogenase expression/formation protein HypE
MEWTCPLPLSQYPRVTMAHGGGGRQSQRLISELFVEAFRNPLLEQMHDGVVVPMTGRVAFTTDSFVVHPRFFPGGNIGSLAVHGTVNDLAMCGATPTMLSAAFVLEEGFSMEELWRIAVSMGQAAKEAGVVIATGDTKVVERGKGDGVYINTSGVGIVREGVDIGPNRVRHGDQVLLSGRIAEHGIAVLSCRQGLEFETPLQSDSASLNGLVELMLQTGGEGIHVLRDPTRGGVATALNEVAQSAGVGTVINEADIPIGPEVAGACELMGFDPLYVANEGKCLAWVDPKVASLVLQAMRSHPLGGHSVLLGEVVAEHPGRVWSKSAMGGTRLLDLLSGEQLPRIC